MSKIKKELITSAWHNLTTETSSKFWGLISVLSSLQISEKVKAGQTYRIDTVELSETLERLFYFGDNIKSYTNNDNFVTFSSVWAERASAIFANGKTSISDAAIYFQIDREFDDDIDLDYIVNSFIAELNLNEEDIESLFDCNYQNITSTTEVSYSKKMILGEITTKYGISLSNDTLTFEHPYSIVSHPAELSRAPFIQSLYAAQSNFECLLLTKFNFNNVYHPNSRDHVDILNELYSLDYSIDELAKILRSMYNSAEDKKKVVSIHMFGIKYGKIIRKNNYSAPSIIKASGLNESYVTELSKALNIYESINTNLFGVRFDSTKQLLKPNGKSPCLQQIFYGAPGTGKSHKVKEITEGKSKTVVTFHPDTDYSSFVGAYKPTLHEDGKTITYGFVPQAFAKAYVNAWKNTDQDYYLVIEEINRGNCAQIFGDIFQLLDRNADGYSDYVIDVDKDFENYLKEELTGIADYPAKIMELAKEADLEGNFSFAKIALPANLHIIATMNTSDQSLFPMDSAFKRRWDWEYRPIDYKKAREVKIDIDGEQYNWGEFIETVNNKIKEINNSEDKQLGTFFVKAKDGIIPFEQFRSKVMFYLWFEVYKDEAGTADCIFRQTEDDSKGFSFGELFEPNAKNIIKNFLKFLKVNPISPVVVANVETSTDTEETE